MAKHLIRKGALPAIAAAAAIAAGCGPQSDGLTIGLLLDYSGSLAHFSQPIENGARLAVEHINEAGGVNGQPVTLITGDSAGDSTQATTEARRLITAGNASAIIGDVGSSITIAIAQNVAADSRIPQISPASSSPAISNLEDNDFLFRTAIADTTQGVVLADDVLERIGGESNLGVLYVNNAYGQGLSRVVRENFNGSAMLVSYEEQAPSFLSELQQAAEGGAEALLVIGYAETAVILREALQDELFQTYYFADANNPAELDLPPDAEPLQNSYGTRPGAAPAELGSGRPSSSGLFLQAYRQKYGIDEPGPFVREAYDAVAAIALAAAAAGSADGTMIRDNLRGVANAPGTLLDASVESLREGLRLASAGNDVNYQGAASVIEWDANGDITGGFVQIWRFANGVSQGVETVPVGGDAP